MKNKNWDKYWENEKGELIEFGNYFMRYYEKAGKIQFGLKYTSSKIHETNYIIKFVLDRKDLCESKEGLPYLQGIVSEWQEWADNND